MAKDLPKLIFPLRLAQLNQHLSGTIGLDRMPRLENTSGRGNTSHGRQNKGNAWVDLRFERREQSPPHVSGTVGVCLSFLCQRCLERVELEITADVELDLIRSGGSDTCAKDEDYVELGENDSVDFAGMVEDELLLALPITALHPEGVCQSIEIASEEVDKATENPFAVLSNLKNQSEKDSNLKE